MTRNLVLVLLACIGCKSMNQGVPAIPPAGHPDTTGWAVLFAPDLSNAINTGGVWSFQDEVLTASEDKFLWTAREYGHFILDLEFKNDEGTNSGVILYCTDTENWIKNSLEVQIADDYAEKWATSPASWQCAAIFGHLPASKRKVKQPGEWNRMTITCLDTMIYVALNGELVTTLDMRLWTSAEKNPDGSDIPPWLARPLSELPTRGRIGLQGKHGDAPIYFRNLRIMEID